MKQMSNLQSPERHPPKDHWPPTNQHSQIQRLDDCVQKLLADLGVLVLEAGRQLVEQRLRLQHVALQQFGEQLLRLLAHRVPRIAQPVDHVRQHGRCVHVEVLAEPADQLGERLQRLLRDLRAIGENGNWDLVSVSVRWKCKSSVQMFIKSWLLCYWTERA